MSKKTVSGFLEFLRYKLHWWCIASISGISTIEITGNYWIGAVLSVWIVMILMPIVEDQ